MLTREKICLHSVKLWTVFTIKYTFMTSLSFTKRRRGEKISFDDDDHCRNGFGVMSIGRQRTSTLQGLQNEKKRGVSERKKEIFYINIGNGPRDSKTTLFDWLAISFTQFIYVQTHEWKEKAQPCAFSQKVSNLFSLSKSKQKGERVREKKLKNAQTMNLLIIIIIIGSITLKITSTLSLQITITLARWW